jgi:AcrR family transcriptional regulator
MLKKKKRTAKKKPEIITRFFRLARAKSEQKGMDISVICRHFKCSPATIYNHEDERRTLTYNQLRRYVEFYGLPAGVVLIITRLTAELRDGKADNAERIALGIQAVAEYLIKNKTALASRNYQEENGKWQNQTLDEFWRVYEAHGLYEPTLPEKAQE